MATNISFWDSEILKSALRGAVIKLSPRHQIRNPVMFTVYIGLLLTLGLFIHALMGEGDAAPHFIFSITAWLWFTLFFANLAEAMAEGRGKAQALRKARRDIQAKKLPNKISLTILLAALTLVFLFVCFTLLPFSIYSVSAAGVGKVVSITVLVALFVCLAPTTIGGLLSAIGIAGMDQMIQANVIALSGRAVEAAGDTDVLILDKTGTITLGNRQATEFKPAEGISLLTLADAAQLASLTDETPEGRSIVILAKEKYGLRGRDIAELGATFIPFTAQTRMSGANLPNRQIRKGAAPTIETYVKQHGGS